jgi:hypothetical protein
MTHFARTKLALLPLLFAALLVTGCGIEARTSLGGQCDLSSECAEPYVCRFDHCRRECVGSRDCGLGLRCLVAQDGLGVCQLDTEKECERNSDCPEQLYCTARECTNGCGDDRDCAPGARCLTQGEISSCLFPETSECLYTSECSEPMVCVREHRECRFECAADRDCPAGLACVVHELCQGPCACRLPCESDPECREPGTACVSAGEGSTVASFCDRASTFDDE